MHRARLESTARTTSRSPCSTTAPRSGWPGKGRATTSTRTTAARIDGVVAPRQPGSALKPFTYALAFERGFTPATVLPDVPAHFPPPSRASCTARATTTACSAAPCARAPRWPARRTCPRSGLLSAGRGARPAAAAAAGRALDPGPDADHYGFALTMGDAEVRLDELVGAYSALARGGVARAAARRAGRARAGVTEPRPAPEEPLVSRARRVLGDRRPLRSARARLGLRLRSSLDFPFPVAVKTGTSQAYRDIGDQRVPGPRLPALPRAHLRQEDGGDEERRRVERERPARADAEHERGRQRRARELRDGLHDRGRRVGLLQHRLGHGLRHEPRERGPEERLRGAEHGLDDHDVPDLDGAGEDQRRQQRVHRRADQIRGQHHAVARQPVRPHAAEQQAADERDRVRGEDEPDVGRRPDLGHVQRQRDEHHPVAERARALSEPEQAELPLSQDPHVSHHAGLMEVDELFDAWERAWSGRELRGFEPICAPDVHYEDPLTPEPLVGYARAGGAREAAVAGDAGRARELDRRAAADGTFACAPCRVLGTHTGPLGRIHPTGRALEVHAVVYAELEDGPAACACARSSTSTPPRWTLGVLPKPGTAGERALLMLRGFGLRG